MPNGWQRPAALEVVDLAAIPLSMSYRQQRGDSLDSRIQAASWGDDYQLLFTATAAQNLPVEATAISSCRDMVCRSVTGKHQFRFRRNWALNIAEACGFRACPMRPACLSHRAHTTAERVFRVLLHKNKRGRDSSCL